MDRGFNTGKVLGCLLAAALSFSSGGCASLHLTPYQQISISSTPGQADIVMDGELIGTTPWTGSIKRGKHKEVRLVKVGYEPEQFPLKSNVHAWVLGNAMWGVFAPMATTIDVKSDKAFMYEKDAYHLILKPAGGDENKEKQTRVEGMIKRFVLSFYSDLLREIVAGNGERLAALKEMVAVIDEQTFGRLCRDELSGLSGPDAFAEKLIETQRLSGKA